MTKTLTNLPQSIWTKVVNRARQRKEDPNLTLSRFSCERLLYRLSTSRHANRFVLKGAMLFSAWTDEPHRSTRDMNLLGFGNPQELAAVFREICSVETEPDDAIRFDPSSVIVERIRDEEEYDGRRLTISGKLGNVKLSVQVDVGFGDVITPGPVELTYPALLEQLPPAKLLAYPRETVVAEKFEAMVKLGMANSRMKDLYDLWVLSSEFEFELQALSAAVHATFERRSTQLPAGEPVALTTAFTEDHSKQTQWKAFLGRTDARAQPALAAVAARLSAFLAPTFRSTHKNNHWSPVAGEWT